MESSIRNRSEFSTPLKTNLSNNPTLEPLQSGFVALAVQLHHRYSSGHGENPDFPLRKTLILRSNISLKFNASDIHNCELGDHKGTLWLNILTLAGVNGVLPMRLTEDILAAKRRGGESLHEFLDLLNRRFWELLVQSYRIGTRPQYGFNDQHAKKLIQVLAQNYVGFKATSVIDQANALPHYQRYLLNFCFQSRNGAGGPKGIAELLSKSISRQVTVNEWIDCKLPTPERLQMRLSAKKNPHFLGRSFLGRRANIKRLLSINVGFEAREWPQFCPAENGWATRALLGAVNASLAGRVVVLGVNFKILIQPSDTARLGQSAYRLGWSARLVGAPAHTSLVRISALAISNIHKQP